MNCKVEQFQIIEIKAIADRQDFLLLTVDIISIYKYLYISYMLAYIEFICIMNFFELNWIELKMLLEI